MACAIVENLLIRHLFGGLSMPLTEHRLTVSQEKEVVSL